MQTEAEKHMQSIDIQALARLFREEADRLSSALSILNGRLREGRAPTNLQIQNLKEGLDAVRERYDAVQEAATALSDKELRSELTVDEYLKAAAAGIERQRQAQLVASKAVIEDFLTVHSSRDKYETILKPLREAAFDLMDAIDAAKAQDIESLTERVALYGAFVEALRAPSGSDQQADIVDEQLATAFPAEVLLGIFTGAYQAGGPRAEREKPQQEPELKPEPAAETEEAKPETAKPPEQESEPEKPKKPEVVIWGEPVEDGGKILKATNRVKTAPPNASSFRKNFMRIMRDAPETADLLQILDHYGAVSANSALYLGEINDLIPEDEMDELEAEQILETLADKGLAARYLVGNETMYGLSAYCANSLRKGTIAQTLKEFWRVPYGGTPRVYGPEEPLERLMKDRAQNDAIVDYFKDRVNEVGFDIYDQILDEIEWTGDHYTVRVFSTGAEPPRTYHLVDELAPAAIPPGEPVIIVGSPLAYDPALIADWEAPVMYVDVEENPNLRDAKKIRRTQETTARPTLADAEKWLDSAMLFFGWSYGELPLRDDELLPRIQASLQRSTDSPAAVQQTIAETITLAKAGTLSDQVKQGAVLSKQLQLATNVRLDDIAYTANELADLFPAGAEYPEAVLYGAYVFAMLTPGLENDYVLRTQAQNVLDSYASSFPSLPQLEPLMRSLNEVLAKTTGGFTETALAMLQSGGESDGYLQTIMEEARDSAAPVTPNVNLKALVPIYKKLLGVGSEFQKCMKIIASDHRADRGQVDAVLEEYCTVNAQGERFVDSDKVNAVLDSYWDTYCHNKNNRKLSYHARDQLVRHLTLRVDLMKRWSDYVDVVETRPREIEELKRLRTAILAEISRLEKNRSWQEYEDANLVDWILQRLRSLLEGTMDDRRLFNSFLRSGYVALDEDGRPILDERFRDVRGYTPWGLVGRHIGEQFSGIRRSFADIREEIVEGPADGVDEESSLLDNLQQLEMIGKLTDEPQSACRVTKEQVKEAIQYAETNRHQFDEDMELAHFLGQITEAEKEQFRNLADAHEDYFRQQRNFASWRYFLHALAEDAKRLARERAQAVREQIEARRKQHGDSPMLDAAESALEGPRLNITLAEETVSRYDLGEKDAGSVRTLQQPEHLDVFLDEFDYLDLYQECRRQGEGTAARPLKRFGPDYFERTVDDDVSGSDRVNAVEFLKSWPASKGAPTTRHIETFLQHLGITVTGAERTQIKGSAEVYHVNVSASPIDATEYTHPIAAFGTKLPAQIDVVAVYGPIIGEQLFETIAGLDLEGMPIVLLDYQLDQGQRRRISEIYHTRKERVPFLLIDRVLALYLSYVPPAERMAAMLQCTLPYTGLQPFPTTDETPDEMFAGRERDIASLLNATGSAIVYGGRQMGKTALLKRTQHRANQPGKRRYAVYVSGVGAETEAQLAERVAQAIDEQTNGSVTIGKADTFAMLSKEIQAARKDKVEALLLLIDDADEILRNLASEDYVPFRPLADLHASDSAFKLVLAGTNETARAARNEETIARLGEKLAIQQLPYYAASALLCTPLEYLGYQADDERELQTLITNTNSYPGILKMLGRALVDKMDREYDRYYSATHNNPPFPLLSEQIGTVMSSKELHEEMNQVVLQTLGLDPRYDMIARCLAWLYISDGGSSRTVYSTEQIQDVASAYETAVLRNETRDSFELLLDEMVAMGILLEPEKGQYRLRRSSLLDVIGRDQLKLEEQLADAKVAAV